MSARDYSIVEYYAEHEGYRCGYCKSTDTNYSHGMWAHKMTVQDYQDLIDRGWRRSGSYCYKPTMHVTCCPMYTIKCAAMDFKLSKSQKKVLKRVHRFLSHGDTKATADDSISAGGSSLTSEGSDFPAPLDIPDVHRKALRAEKNLENTKVTSVDPSLSGRIDINKEDSEIVQDKDKDVSEVESSLGDAVPSETIEKGSAGSETRKAFRSGSGADSSRPPCKKAKLIRLERKHQKLLKQGYSEDDVNAMMKRGKQQQEGKSVEDLLDEPLPANPAHRLEIRLVRSSPPSHEFEQTSQQAYEVYRKYQMAVHGDPPDKCTLQQYMRFLVKSPLQPWHPRDGPPQGYGSFHQQYWMDGKLIAVGVIDILPRCVSSVYFYYDPDLGQLSLGTYASLREIYLTRSLHGQAPSLQYYYMGFYIHTCPKMRYKASYNPSFLLCPETYTWHPIGQCKVRLDQNKYCRFNDDPSAQDKDGEVALNEVLVLSKQRAMLYCMYIAMKPNANDADEVAQYAKLVGMKCARRMLLVRT